MKEFIICSAVWYKNLELNKTDIPKEQYLPKNITEGMVFCGHRHVHCIRQMNVVTGKRAAEVGFEEQGFLTSLNRFVNRKEAYKIAFENDQIQGPNKGYSENSIGLTSEDLY